MVKFFDFVKTGFIFFFEFCISVCDFISSRDLEFIQLNIMVLLSPLVSFFIIILYISIAKQFKIVDVPNHRSSHSRVTIRGGGVIIPLIWFFWFVLNDYPLTYLTIALLILSIFGFWDDIKNLDLPIRIAAQIISFLLIWYQLFGNSNWTLWVLPIAIITIGALNAVNFMDGINGITGLYALAFFIPLQLKFTNHFFEPSPWILLIIAILSFGFFNFRKNAICFLGDVGSLTIGLVFIFYILALIYGFNPLKINEVSKGEFNISYLLLLSLYGIDVILTLFQRLFQGHKLSSPHRMHFYQILVNENNVPHLLVSFLYAFFQLLINIWVLWYTPTQFQSLLLILFQCIIYIILKRNLTQNK
jgi:UDP-N-acetylmuramyl pentapeptide phosphotransferase/UDP-N-acetylglucosamine-1-phosphate transferase